MKKILIVEDNKDSREILGLFVTKFGHQPIKACNSREAITYAEAECPNLIFMDLDLPDADGIKTTAILKRIPKPLIFLSLRLRRGCRHYRRKKLRTWVLQPT
jgi:two-component system response regulator VanR